MGLVTSGQSEIEALLTQALGVSAGRETQRCVQSAGFYEQGSLPAFLLLLRAHPILAVQVPNLSPGRGVRPSLPGDHKEPWITSRYRHSCNQDAPHTGSIKDRF